MKAIRSTRATLTPERLMVYCGIGRSSDLFLPGRLPGCKATSGMRRPGNITELTAAGTVPDSHRIPFFVSSLLPGG